MSKSLRDDSLSISVLPIINRDDLLLTSPCSLNDTKLTPDMSIPETYRAFRRTTGDLRRTITVSTEPLPRELGPRDVLLKIHAVSLNFRDPAMLHGRYPVDVLERGIPGSDAAAEVAAIGSAVQGFVVGDRVSVVADLGNLTEGDDDPWSALGGDVEGVLREYAVYEDKYIVHLPKHLSWEEVSCVISADRITINHCAYVASNLRLAPSPVLASQLGLPSTASKRRIREVPSCKAREALACLPC